MLALLFADSWINCKKKPKNLGYTGVGDM